MRLVLQIIDDDGTLLAEHKADATQPSLWRAPSGQRFVSDMPRNSDALPTGMYELFGITLQPHVRIDRPNGYIPQIPVIGNSPQPPFQSIGVPQSSLSGPFGPLKG